ncbi:MAG TPA: hypothetical protein VGE08_11710 [Steroidobacter sp.]|uniref:hypothetical protein n=1 Tax=Steroidobacter sp. TaxID=1978227 RepID=UPI002ED9EE28
MSESTDKPLHDGATDGSGADEQQLEEYLKGDSSVSRQYRQLHSAEVPAELDRLVLRQAEEAVKNRSAQGRPAWMRWTAPLAVAASAVLALSIVIQTGLRDDTVTAVSAQKAPQPTTQAERERVESKPIEEVVAEQVVPLTVVQESAAPTFAPSAPPPSPLQMDVPVTEPAMSPPSGLEPRAATQSRPAPPPVAAPAPAKPAASGQSIAQSADVITRELESMAMEPPRQKKAIEHNAQEQSTAVADDLARERKEEDRSTEAKAYSRRINAEMPAAARAYSDPEIWLKDIRELRKANKQEEADREWRRFRSVFPDYAVAETDLAREVKK